MGNRSPFISVRGNSSLLCPWKLSYINWILGIATKVMEGEKTRIIEREQSGKREREGWRESKIKKIVSEKNLLVETKY